LSGPPQGASGPPQRASGPPQGVSGPPQGASETPQGASGPPQGASEPPQGASGPPQGHLDHPGGIWAIQGASGLPRGCLATQGASRPPHGASGPPHMFQRYLAYTSEDFLSKSQNKIQPHLNTITIYYHKTEQKLDNIKNSVVESLLKLLTLVRSPLAVKTDQYNKGNLVFSGSIT
jgi:hypothetical protein